MHPQKDHCITFVAFLCLFFCFHREPPSSRPPSARLLSHPWHSRPRSGSSAWLRWKTWRRGVPLWARVFRPVACSRSLQAPKLSFSKHPVTDQRSQVCFARSQTNIAQFKAPVRIGKIQSLLGKRNASIDHVSHFNKHEGRGSVIKTRQTMRVQALQPARGIHRATIRIFLLQLPELQSTC